MCAAVVAVATFLPWQTTTTAAGTKSVQGTAVNEGQIVLIVCLVTVGLVQVGWRPAWIAAGFAGATTIREILRLSGDGKADPAAGLWIAAIASVIAVILLVWDMFTNVARAPDDDDDSAADRRGGKPPKRGLSGPLGRRRR